jgi:hypothetical protein
MPSIHETEDKRHDPSDLLPFEHADIRLDVADMLANADQWLAAPNVIYGGRAPQELIGTPDEYLLRATLRSARYTGMS